MKRILVLYFLLLSLITQAQEEKFRIEFGNFDFKNLKEAIQFRTSFKYPEQIYCEVELEITNLTNETLVEASILENTNAHIGVIYDKTYKLVPFIYDLEFYKKVSAPRKFSYVSFDNPWKPNETITLKVVFAKIVELDAFNLKKTTEEFASTLKRSHLNFPPQDAYIYFDISAKGVYGKQYKEEIKGSVKELLLESVEKIKEKEKEEIKQKEQQQKEEEKKKKKSGFLNVLDNVINQL